jgi:hypothetical protein
MASSGMLRREALVRTDVSEELRASIIRVTIGELGTLVVTINRGALRRNTQHLTETSTKSRNKILLGCGTRPGRNAKNIVTICEPTV